MRHWLYREALMGGTIPADALDMILGERLGRGQFREVFAAAWDPDNWVVKVETEATRFHNPAEWQFWQHWCWESDYADWLAPCGPISGNGIWLVQARTYPVPEAELPAKVPAWMSDLKPSNFGLLRATGRVVCHDYGMTVSNPAKRLLKAEWR